MNRIVNKTDEIIKLIYSLKLINQFIGSKRVNVNPDNSRTKSALSLLIFKLSALYEDSNREKFTCKIKIYGGCIRSFPAYMFSDIQTFI